MRTRIAPTPSGFLHMGNAVNFLLTVELARRYDATVLLRIDDLDAERVRPEYVAGIFEVLERLGITWQEGPGSALDLSERWSQRQRVPQYLEHLDRLAAEGHVYACTCSRVGMDACICKARQLPLDLPEAAWRLAIPAGCSVAVNGFHGARAWRLDELMRDPVLRQRSGRPAYQIASLSDDALFHIDLIVRGEDLLPSTVCQLFLARLLGLDAFSGTTFVHHPLVLGDDGTKLSKSAGPDKLRASGRLDLSVEEARTKALTFLHTIS